MSFPSKLDDISIWTFGQPRSGNPEFAQYTQNRFRIIRRIVNKSDFAAYFPSDAYRNQKWTHHSRELWINFANETILCSDNSAESKDCSDGRRNYNFIRSIFDLRKIVFSKQFHEDMSYHTNYFGLAFGPFC